MSLKIGELQELEFRPAGTKMNGAAHNNGAGPLLARRLNPSDRKSLQRCEKIIGEGAAAFLAVGLALREIRNRRLYRESHATFEAYCVDKFDFRRAHGNRLIAEATAIVDLDLPSNILPQNEGQARELESVLAEMRVEVLRLAHKKSGGKHLTATLIREAAVELGAAKVTDGKLIPAGGDDCVATPDSLARAIVQHFMPSGRVLDPCKGGGAFLRAFPKHCVREWCELREGRDFLQVVGQHWDWVISNPPYSKFREFLVKAMKIGDNVVFLSLTNAWFIRARQADIQHAKFGLVELLEVPVPKPPFPQFGMCLTAAWLRRGWGGSINYTRLKPKEFA